MKNMLWILVLAFVSCTKNNKDCPAATEKAYTLTGFNSISAGEAFSLQVKQDAAFAVKVKGCADDLNDLALTVGPDGVFTLAYNHYKNDRYRVDVEISLPTLAKLALSGAATATVSGFGQQADAMRLDVSGVAKCTIDQLPLLVRADASGTGVITLNGTTPDLITKLSGDARLNAYTATVSDADVYTSGTARAYVAVQNSLVAIASGDSRIYYKGSPASLNAEESGTAKVIRE